MSQENERGRGYCSWCLLPVEPVLVKEHTFGRNALKCGECGKTIAACVVPGCGNYACYGEVKVAGKNGPRLEKLYHHFCGEHCHWVPDFTKTGDTLDDPSQYQDVFQYRCVNFAKRSKQVGLGVGAAAITGPIAWMAAPAIGGALGSALGLQGVAATNHGLALLGGGSLASGGLGMAGGTAAVAGAGSLLGGAGSNVIAARYLRNDKSFGIKKIREGHGPAVVTINGFLSEKGSDLSDWESMFPPSLQESAWYHVDWESKNLRKLGRMCGSAATSKLLQHRLIAASKRAGKIAAKKLAVATAVYDAIALSTNPWHVAMNRSAQTGVLLADILARCKNQQFILCGHSLGARAMYFALAALVQKPEVVVHSAHLFGGAVSSSREPWMHACKAVSHKIHNYHSDRDQILKHMYTVGTLFRSTPIGRNPIPDVPGVVNHDVTPHVNGHMMYKTAAVSGSWGT